MTASSWENDSPEHRAYLLRYIGTFRTAVPQPNGCGTAVFWMLLKCPLLCSCTIFLYGGFWRFSGIVRKNGRFGNFLQELKEKSRKRSQYKALVNFIYWILTICIYNNQRNGRCDDHIGASIFRYVEGQTLRKLKDKNRSRLIHAAMGKLPCDLIVKNVQ